METKNENDLSSLKILKECFHNFSTKESKDLLWRFFATMTLGNFSSLPQDEKENLFAFYSHLQRVLDAAGELAEEEKDQTSQNRIFKNIPKNPE